MSETPPNIVLVSMDSLRGDHCGHLGSEHSLTPTMDALAEDGICFQNAVSPGPQTFSSMPTVFTGHHRPSEWLDSYPGETHWERRLAAINTHLRYHPTLQERLQKLGYTTVGITPNPWTSAATSFNRGFDEFIDLSNNKNDGRLPSLLGRLPGVDTDDRSVELAINMLTGSSFFSKWEEIYEQIDRIRDQLTEPYFLWVFLLDTHFPFLCSRTHRTEQRLPGMYYSAYQSEKQMRGREEDSPMADSVEQSVRRSYRDTVRASDAFLERAVADFDDATFIVHSDHGESFGEHGNYGHHHRELYDENIHVPYVIYNGGCSAEVTAPVSLASIFDATLSLARTGTVDPAEQTAEYVVSKSECGRNRAVRGTQFKYIETPDGELLFDLSCDPNENEDISQNWPQECERFQTVLDRFETTRVETHSLQQTTQSLATQGVL